MTEEARQVLDLLLNEWFKVEDVTTQIQGQEHVAAEKAARQAIYDFVEERERWAIPVSYALAGEQERLNRWVSEVLDARYCMVAGFNTHSAPEDAIGCAVLDRADRWFLTYANGREQAEGGVCVLANTAGKAVDLFIDGWEAFSAAHPGNTILWRQRPFLMSLTPDLRDGVEWLAYARLLIVTADPGKEPEGNDAG